MAKVKKKTTPITQRSEKKFKHSSKETAKLIRRYHVLNKELAKCRSSNDREKEQQILAEMEAMGGLDWYQRASQLGQSKSRGGDSSKWLLQKLEKHGYKGGEEKLRLLEIGAVAPDNYDKVKSWITVLPIDLNPQDPRIKKQDFLEMKPTEKFDVLSLSLVVNFVGDPKDRGKMLLHTRDFLDGPHRLLYLVLPLPCITNSRYMSHEHLITMMTAMGYSCIEHHFSKKLAYYLFHLENVNKRYQPFKKTLLPDKQGGNRNNFCIVIE